MKVQRATLRFLYYQVRNYLLRRGINDSFMNELAIFSRTSEHDTAAHEVILNDITNLLKTFTHYMSLHKYHLLYSG